MARSQAHDHRSGDCSVSRLCCGLDRGRSRSLSPKGCTCRRSGLSWQREQHRDPVNLFDVKSVAGSFAVGARDLMSSAVPPPGMGDMGRALRSLPRSERGAPSVKPASSTAVHDVSKPPRGSRSRPRSCVYGTLLVTADQHGQVPALLLRAASRQALGKPAGTLNGLVPRYPPDRTAMAPERPSVPRVYTFEVGRNTPLSPRTAHAFPGGGSAWAAGLVSLPVSANVLGGEKRSPIPATLRRV